MATDLIALVNNYALALIFMCVAMLCALVSLSLTLQSVARSLRQMASVFNDRDQESR